MKKLSALLLIFTTFLTVKAQDCGCDITLKQSGVIYANELPKVPKPGDVICIPAGTYGFFRLYDFVGTKEEPITFKNCGGRVIVSDDTYTGIQFRKSKHIIVDGTGSEDFEYGIKVAKAKSSGISISDLSTDAEIHHVEVTNTGFACITAKTDPTCDDDAGARGNFLQENLVFHDNYLHDNEEGEGFYIGFTSNYELGKTDNKCPEKTLFGHLIHGVKLYNNKIVNTAWDGLQISQATEGVEVYNNYMENFGILTDRPDQKFGIAFGSGTVGKIYSNTVIGGENHGIYNNGLGPVYIFNNLVVNSKGDGIYNDHVNSFAPGNGYYIANNTLVKPTRYGIYYNNGKNLLESPFECYNNLIVDPGVYEEELGKNYWGEADKQSYIGFKTKESFQLAESDLSHNIYLLNVEDAGFVNADLGWYGLAENSIAIDSGLSTTEFKDLFGFDTDLSNDPERKRQGRFDVGAIEFGNPVGLSDNENDILTSERIMVYPNPVIGNEGFEVELKLMQAGNYDMSLLSLAGKEEITLEKSVSFKVGTNRLKVKKELATGMYLLKVVGDGFFEVTKLQIK